MIRPQEHDPSYLSSTDILLGFVPVSVPDCRSVHLLKNNLRALRFSNLMLHLLRCFGYLFGTVFSVNRFVGRPFLTVTGNGDDGTPFTNDFIVVVAIRRIFSMQGLGL